MDTYIYKDCKWLAQSWPVSQVIWLTCFFSQENAYKYMTWVVVTGQPTQQSQSPSQALFKYSAQISYLYVDV